MDGAIATMRAIKPTTRRIDISSDIGGEGVSPSRKRLKPQLRGQDALATLP
jgi:hypothetical protein